MFCIIIFYSLIAYSLFRNNRFLTSFSITISLILSTDIYVCQINCCTRFLFHPTYSLQISFSPFFRFGLLLFVAKKMTRNLYLLWAKGRKGHFVDGRVCCSAVTIKEGLEKERGAYRPNLNLHVPILCE